MGSWRAWTGLVFLVVMTTHVSKHFTANGTELTWGVDYPDVDDERV